ncbi:hypothetical protein DSO57_1000019 [Entomophthora muscae]|uniref:Uncharacterized protein n=1 Tax=Entomophthora muscae TaxID=34485 RepID=A0ACC2SMN1_9FUNG|nr:hypothetical protein DSO57_1000019 [Entomophthora muscae]
MSHPLNASNTSRVTDAHSIITAMLVSDQALFQAMSYDAKKAHICGLCDRDTSKIFTDMGHEEPPHKQVRQDPKSLPKQPAQEESTSKIFICILLEI